MEPNIESIASERRRGGLSAHETATAELVSLARDLGIYASTPRTAEEVTGLFNAVRKQIGQTARRLAFTCRDIGAGQVNL